jgi:NAD(P)-dependent dehydrogenase (short-subunit alcohol dehydrogenase family)
MSRTWLITGASSGLGRLLSERVASSGDDVIAVDSCERRLNELAAEYPDHISPVALDPTGSTSGAVTYAAIRDAGGVDVLVDAIPFEARAVTRAALSALRLSQGRIVHVLSVFGERAVHGSAPYPAVKSALAPAFEAMALELAPEVRITTVHLGRFGPDASSETTLPPEERGDPNMVLDALFAVVNATQPPRRLAVGDDAVESIRETMPTSIEAMAEWGPVGGWAF